MKKGRKYGIYKSIGDRISTPIWHLDGYKLCQAYSIVHKFMSAMITVAISDDTENVETLGFPLKVRESSHQSHFWYGMGNRSEKNV